MNTALPLQTTRGFESSDVSSYKCSFSTIKEEIAEEEGRMAVVQGQVYTIPHHTHSHVLPMFLRCVVFYNCTFHFVHFHILVSCWFLSNPSPIYSESMTNLKTLQCLFTV